jgi:hypothetical protein
VHGKKSWERLKDKTRGPKTKSRHKEEVEIRILDIRFRTPDKDV